MGFFAHLYALPLKFFIALSIAAVVALVFWHGGMAHAALPTPAYNPETAEIYNWMNWNHPEDGILVANGRSDSILFNYMNCDADDDGVIDFGADARCSDYQGVIGQKFQVKVNFSQSTPSQQVLSGYAWNPILGKITFSEPDLAGCPSAPCKAYIDETTNPPTLNGWAKVVDPIEWKLPRFGPIFRDTTDGTGNYKNQAIALNGNYLYVGGRLTGGSEHPFLSIYDVSNPSNPILESHTDIVTGDSQKCTWSCDVTAINYAEWNGKKLVFVSQYEFGWFAYDVTDFPSNPPQLVGWFLTGGGQVWATAISSDNAYIAGSIDGSPACGLGQATAAVAYVDLNALRPSPASELTLQYLPTTRTCFVTGSAANGQDLAVYDNYLILADGSNGILVFDILDPTNALFSQSIGTPEFSGSPNDAWAYGVYVDSTSKRLYVAKHNNNNASSGISELMIVPLRTNVAQPLNTGNIRRVRIDTPANLRGTTARGVTAVTDPDGTTHAFIAGSAGGVLVYDVTDENNITEVAHMISPFNSTSTSPYFANYTGANALSLSGKTYKVAYSNGVLYASVCSSCFGTKNPEAFSVFKAQDQWINLSGISYDPDYTTLSGVASNSGYVMGPLTIPNNNNLYVSRQPVVGLQATPQITPPVPGTAWAVDWAVTKNASSCTASDNSTNSGWVTMFNFVAGVFNGSVGPFSLTATTPIRLDCYNLFGKQGNLSLPAVVTAPPGTAPQCGTMDHRSFSSQRAFDAAASVSPLCAVGVPSPTPPNPIPLLNGKWTWSCNDVNGFASPVSCQSSFFKIQYENY